MAYQPPIPVRRARSNPTIRRIIDLTYPEYRGRKVAIQPWNGPTHLQNYWDGGTRSYWRLIDPVNSRIADGGTDNPFTAEAHERWDLPDGMIAVEHVYFCGHDLGLRIHYRPERQPFIEQAVRQLEAR
jgi:hypothetical protein